MKLFYACAVIALVALVAPTMANYHNQVKVLRQSCMQETKATDEDLKKFYTNGMKAEFATEPVKCHLKCMMEKYGTLKNDVFDDAAFVERARQAPFLKNHIDAVTKAAAACKNEKGVNPCDTAYKITTCIKTKKEAAGIPRMMGAI